MRAPNVSIIIPSYNQAESLASLLASIRSSRLDDYEIIVVDDGSTDETAAICSSAPGVRRLALSRNGGPARARNLGAAEARGAVLVFIDSDVTLFKDRDVLFDMVRSLDEDPSLDYVVTISDVQPAVLGAVAYHYSVYHAYYMERLLMGRKERRGALMLFTTRLGAITREAFRRTGGFHESLWTVMNEDGEFGARIYHQGLRGLCRADFTHRHRYATSFLHLLRNYFLTAMVQAQIARKMDTSPDPSVSTAEMARRLLALALLTSPLSLLWLSPRQALAAALLLLAALLAGLGRLHTLVWRHVPPRIIPAWYAVYVGVTPAIALGYLYGLWLDLRGRSLLAGPPSLLEFFEASP